MPAQEKAVSTANAILDSDGEPGELENLASEYLALLKALEELKGPDGHVMRGQITLAAGVPIGKCFPMVAIVGQLEVCGEAEVKLHLQFDYHIFPPKSGLIRMMARPITERDKFPNWPNDALPYGRDAT